jgi:hypothetical protein
LRAVLRVDGYNCVERSAGQKGRPEFSVIACRAEARMQTGSVASTSGLSWLPNVQGRRLTGEHRAAPL